MHAFCGAMHSAQPRCCKVRSHAVHHCTARPRQRCTTRTARARAQVEERLRFYDEGVAPRKNATVMAEAVTLFKDALSDDDAMDADQVADVLAGVPAGTLPGAGGDEGGSETKKKKKSKKRDSVRTSAATGAGAPGRLSVFALPMAAQVVIVSPVKSFAAAHLLLIANFVNCSALQHAN